MVTLDPSQMETMGQQVYDISGVQAAKLRTPRNVLLSMVYKKGQREGRESVEVPFPPGTKGVIYYHLSPGCPPQAGELRFKKCDTVDQFHEGEDLEVDAGQPWSLSLLNIVQSTPRNAFLRELLVEPGLVDQELVADLRRLFDGAKDKDPGHGFGFSRGGLTLHDIDQPFVTDVHITGFTARLVTRQSIQRISDIYTFWPSAGHPVTARSPPPFYGIFGSAYPDRIGLILTPSLFLLGRIRARFELTDPPDDKGRLTLHLRILDILTPIEHHGKQGLIAEPRAGELLLRRRKENFNFTPWAYSPRIGGNNHKALLEFLKCRAADKAKFGV
jgi:hypothetical protein